jgi:hypothetical protein
MASIVKLDSSGQSVKELKNILMNQDLIEDIDSNEEYSSEDLYKDVCNLLKTVKYMNEKSLLKTVSEINLKNFVINFFNYSLSKLLVSKNVEKRVIQFIENKMINDDQAKVLNKINNKNFLYFVCID